MKTIRYLCLTVLLLVAPMAIGPLAAAPESASNLLAEGLMAEEVRRDPAAAAEAYEQVLQGVAEHQALAATALFRLAEVRRKQDRKDEAIALYQRLLREFPAAAEEGKLARQNLAALGGDLATAASPGREADPEQLELDKLRKMQATHPDVLASPQHIEQAIEKGHLRVAEFLLAAGPDPSSALVAATTSGNLEMV